MTDFPDSWTWAQVFAVGTLPSFVLPPIVGVTHVVDAISLFVQWNGAQLAGVIYPEVIQANAGALNPALTLPPVTFPAGTGEWGSDRSDNDGLGFALGVGIGINIQANIQVPANMSAALTVKGHCL